MSGADTQSVAGNVESFRKALLSFYEAHARDLPWRARTDVYGVLVSEFMLQQTQVSRVIPKYDAFMQRFPNVDTLRDASFRDVLALWQGLGYNRRAKYVQEAASFLVEHPDPSYDELLALKGVGPYTAAAIRVFATNEDRAGIEVNVRRVVSRYFGEVDDAFIASLVPQGRSRDWHNALMDFGSILCTKRSPACDACPLQDSCHAFRNDTFSLEPSRSQGRFEGSVRWHRGQVLKLVLEKPRPREELWGLLGAHSDSGRFRAALDQLRDEGLVVEDDDVRIA